VRDWAHDQVAGFATPGEGPVDGWTSDAEAAGFSRRQSISVGILNRSHLVAGTPVVERLGVHVTGRVVLKISWKDRMLAGKQGCDHCS
jgi:hypothetical protein